MPGASDIKTPSDRSGETLQGSFFFGLYVGPKTLISCCFITIGGGVRIEYMVLKYSLCAFLILR